MSEIRIYTAPLQPATDYTDDCGSVEMRCGYAPETLLYTGCCGHRHPAKDCVVQCFYDGLRIWCADGKGCKDPMAIAERKARAFRNRSAGQRARWASA